MISHRPGRRAPGMLLAVALAFVLSGTFTAAPARAQSQSDILGALASAASILITNRTYGSNVNPSTVVGHTRDGGTVYADGRIVYGNGDTLYTANSNGSRCSYNGSYNRCGSNPVAYYPRVYRGHDHGNHYGQIKHGRWPGDNGHGNRNMKSHEKKDHEHGDGDDHGHGHN